jgi:hypothetical protein
VADALSAPIDEIHDGAISREDRLELIAKIVGDGTRRMLETFPDQGEAPIDNTFLGRGETADAKRHGTSNRGSGKGPTEIL